MTELGDEADLLLNLIPVSVVGPEEDVQGYCECLPYELDRTVLSVSNVLDRG